MDLPVKEGLKMTCISVETCIKSWIPTRIAFYGLTCKRRPEDDLYIGRNMLPM